MKIIQQFIDQLSDLKFPSTFNPYSEICQTHDSVGADSIRRKNLFQLLDAAMKSKVDALWVARDLGYRGGRRTGIPLTDEAHLEVAAKLLGGVKFERATQGAIVKERTASIIWDVLGNVGQPVMLWNVFPLHPYVGIDHMTNRCHNKIEREAAWPLLISLIEMLSPTKVFAIGRDSQNALGSLDISIINVRHPSYGGQAEFIETVYSHYEIARPVPSQLSLSGLSDRITC